MSEGNNKSSHSNGSTLDTLQRLSSFKTPRDLTLGGAKPNKKVFTPNLNVSRNKNKSVLPTVTRDKKDNDKGRRDKKNDRNKNIKNGPNIIKGSGVFSEGMGATERQYATRTSYGRDVDAAPTLQKPTLRVKDVWKIDKELEDQKIKKVLGDTGSYSDEEASTGSAKLDRDAPIRLPLSDGGWLHSKPKVFKPKSEVVVKQEPTDDFSSVLEQKPPVQIKSEPHEDTDIVTLLRSDKPALIMLQFPDSLPGRARTEIVPPSKKTTNSADATTSNDVNTDEKPVSVADDRCRLADLEEGKIGKLIIHRSGRVRLQLGETMFEVAAGTQNAFRQEVVSVAVDDNSKTANLVSLGALPHKLNLLPHWESLLADVRL